MKTRLRVLRAELEWTQADLAERLGVSRQTINAIETGRYDSSLPLAIRIARLFGKAVEGVSFLDGGPSEQLARRQKTSSGPSASVTCG